MNFSCKVKMCYIIQVISMLPVVYDGESSTFYMSD